MASDQNMVDFIVGQIRGAASISAKKMFGEYGLYGDGKLFGLVCDNKLFIKPTAKGRAFIGTPTEYPAYEGAKPGFLIEDKLEDGNWLGQLVKITLDSLPEPKSKKQKK